jgi:hypothetical protein
MLFEKKNGEDVSGCGQHSHPGGTYRNPVLQVPPILWDRYVCALCSGKSIAVADISDNKQFI